MHLLEAGPVRGEAVKNRSRGSSERNSAVLGGNGRPRLQEMLAGVVT